MLKIVCSIILFSHPVFASTITLADCYKSFKENNKSILEAKAEWQASQSLYESTKGAFWPQIKASLSTTKVGTEGQVEETSSQIGLSLSQNLFAGFSDQLLSEQYYERSRISFLKYQQIKQESWIIVQRKFAEVEFNQDALKASRQNLQRRQENYKMVELRYSSGRENKGSLILSQAYYEQAKLELSTTEKALFQAKKELSELIGVQVSQVLGSPASNLSDGSQSKRPDFNILVERDFSYQIAALEESLARISFKSAQARFYPSLDLNGSISRLGEGSSFDHDKWTAGLVLSVPLFDGFADVHNRSALSQTLTASTLKKESKRTSVESQTRQAYDNFINSQQKVKVDELFKTATILRAEVSRKKYNNGLMSFEEWDQVEGELINREKNYLSSLKELSVSSAQWRGYESGYGELNE